MPTINTPNHKSRILLTLALALCMQGCSQIAQPSLMSGQSFSSPDQAVDTLVQALRINDQEQLSNILGPESAGLISSGDAVADRNGVEKFLKAFDDKHQLLPNPDGGMTSPSATMAGRCPSRSSRTRVTTSGVLT